MGPRRLAFGGFGIVGASFAARTASDGDAFDVQLEPLAVADDAQAVADLDLPRGLDPLTVDLDMPAIDRFLRETASLEKSRAPQPFVDAQAAGSGRPIGTTVIVAFGV